MEEPMLHWSFSAVRKTIAEHGEQELFTCASGVTPSGTIHIGNFREIITVDLVKRAFARLNKNVRHIHSWDDYDVFRKVPKNMPNKDILEKHLRMSITDTPDTTGKFNSFAEMNMRVVENTLPIVGINPIYIYQSKKYTTCEYADEIKKAIEKTEDIKNILNQYRKEPLSDDWLPVSIFCDSCKKDTISNVQWKGGYIFSYECECGHSEEFDIRKKGIIKLNWRVDWPMRWHYEKVHFEPAGKDHFAAGGSRQSGVEIQNKIWNEKEPNGFMYEWIAIKGGGEFSSSSGNATTLNDVLKIYEPEIIRHFFAGSRPNATFDISFDTDVMKKYEDYDKCERIYYKKVEAKEKEKEKQKLIYEFSQIDEDITNIPKEMPLQISFRHLTTILQIKSMDEKETLEFFRKEIKNDVDEKRVKTRISCVKNWIELYADEQFKFSVKKSRDEEFFSSLKEKDKKSLSLLKEAIENNTNEESLSTAIFDIPKSLDIKIGDFFTLCYKAVIGKEKGPKLAPFILEIGRESILKLL